MKKGPDYKQMRYLTFEPISELEMVIFEKCSFDQPPLLHPSPLRASDKPSPSSKTTYSKTTHWLQQSQKNVDHFWKKDTALVKALRQYHFASGALEGRTQWKFQKSRILHKVLDVIALNMESTGRCLDFRDSNARGPRVPASGHEPPMSESCSSKRGGALDYGPCVG